ncbi:hypothetical protein SanaruYs_34650 [Chryseotalea sanaruensis]|uniref:Uncharacterized protein n=1 Tax=Chryseotalea sanaruensis TaxID=2482724 RepID=A0A401UED5_9BACT|nr:hypothetical protein SanaruYs_34650 [Chryseotalea sanaruensis]
MGDTTKSYKLHVWKYANENQLIELGRVANYKPKYKVEVSSRTP